MKRCTKCGEEKPLDAFHRSPATPDGRQTRCKVCVGEDRKRRYWEHVASGRRAQEVARDRDRARELKLLSAYGMTLAEYDALLAKQQHRCAICGCQERARRTRGEGPCRLSVDHDHATGKVRGLLCTACNKALGAFQDRPDLLHSAIAYLEAI